MYCLYDTFNNRIVSRHRTVTGLVKAEIRMQNRVSRQSPGSYLPTDIRRLRDDKPEKLHDLDPAFCSYRYHPLRG